MAFERGLSRRGSRDFRSEPPNQVEWMRLPPAPARVVMTDRANGTRWLLSYSTAFNTSDGFGHFSITDDLTETVNRGELPRIYGAYDGPYLASTPIVRLLIRNGYLGYDIVEQTGVASMDSPPVYGRKPAFNRSVRRLIVPVGFRYSPDLLGWTPEDL